MQILLTWTAMLVGPCYVFLLAGLQLSRRLFPEVQVLYELAEPILLFLAAVFALAIAGIIVQLG